MKPSIKKSEVDLERFEERAAIIEYDGKFSRSEAERIAREEQIRVEQMEALSFELYKARFNLSLDLTLPKSSK